MTKKTESKKAVTLRWIQGHKKVKGNEVVGKLAKRIAYTPVIGENPFVKSATRHCCKNGKTSITPDTYEIEEEDFRTLKPFDILKFLKGIRLAKLL